MREWDFLNKLQGELRKKFPSATVETHQFDPFQPDSSFVVTILDYKHQISIAECRRVASYIREDELIRSIVEAIEVGVSEKELEKLKLEVFNFGKAVEKAFAGNMITRKSWNDGSFVFAQVPSEIDVSIVPKMTSLPPRVKEEFVKRGKNLFYSDQFAIVHPDNRINGWSPTPSDCLAEDWTIL